MSSDQTSCIINQYMCSSLILRQGRLFCKVPRDSILKAICERYGFFPAQIYFDFCCIHVIALIIIRPIYQVYAQFCILFLDPSCWRLSSWFVKLSQANHRRFNWWSNIVDFSNLTLCGKFKNCPTCMQPASCMVKAYWKASCFESGYYCIMTLM